MLYKSDSRGVALIWVLVMLAIVGTLAGILLRSAITHTSITMQEEARSQAFHSAEAGVDFIISNLDTDWVEKIMDNEKKFVGRDYNFHPEPQDITFGYGGDINFNVRVENVSQNDTGEDNILFTSAGEYNGYSESIQFGVNIMTLDGFENPINIYERHEEREKHFDLRGSDDYDISVTDRWEGMEWEEFWQLYLGDSEDYDYIDGNLNLSPGGSGDNVESYHTYVVDGNFNLSGNEQLDNNIVIVRDYVDIDGGGGSINFENSLILIYANQGQGNDGYYIDSGSPATEFGDFNPEEIIDGGGEANIRVDSWEQQK